jgi:hypothetical protein
MNRGEVWCDDMDWVCVARGGNKWRSRMETVTNFSASWSSVHYAKLWPLTINMAFIFNCTFYNRSTAQSKADGLSSNIDIFM